MNRKNGLQLLLASTLGVALVAMTVGSAAAAPAKSDNPGKSGEIRGVATYCGASGSEGLLAYIPGRSFQAKTGSVGDWRRLGMAIAGWVGLGLVVAMMLATGLLIGIVETPVARVFTHEPGLPQNRGLGRNREALVQADKLLEEAGWVVRDFKRAIPYSLWHPK